MISWAKTATFKSIKEKSFARIKWPYICTDIFYFLAIYCGKFDIIKNHYLPNLNAYNLEHTKPRGCSPMIFYGRKSTPKEGADIF